MHLKISLYGMVYDRFTVTSFYLYIAKTLTNSIRKVTIISVEEEIQEEEEGEYIDSHE